MHVLVHELLTCKYGRSDAVRKVGDKCEEEVRLHLLELRTVTKSPMSAVFA